VEISVSDTGVGIAPEDQPKVFEEFRQVGSDYAHKVEGTGLGLTLVKKFVELDGGRIWVKSEVGKGATFTFTLPITAVRWSATVGLTPPSPGRSPGATMPLFVARLLVLSLIQQTICRFPDGFIAVQSSSP
jgi:Histidine kinase-, DNA gyrase B-, and HSP90-like ATPase